MSYQDFRDRLASANDPSFYPIEWVDWMLESGGAQYWETPNAAMVTQVLNYPGGAKAIRSIATAGDLEDIISVLAPQIEAWAADQGCTHSLVEGRDGWRRSLKHRGYGHHQTLILKVL